MFELVTCVRPFEGETDAGWAVAVTGDIWTCWGLTRARVSTTTWRISWGRRWRWNAFVLLCSL